MEFHTTQVKPVPETTGAAPGMETPLERLCAMLETERSGVENILIRQTRSNVATIPDVSGYLVTAGGKRVRPLIALAAARAARADLQDMPDAVLKLAAAVEFIHTATLLHDDVIDESDLRRGRAAAKNVWGAPASILVGDFLFACAFNLMVETGSLRALGVLSKASSVIAEGEVGQLAAKGRSDLGEKEYMAIADAKTAALFAAAGRASAIAVAADDAVCEALGTYGRHLGRAFQLTDDLLDYGGVAAVTGKAMGDDFREGKMTMPAVIARQRGGDEARVFWHSAVRADRRTEADLTEAIARIRATGAGNAVLSMARKETMRARAALDRVPATPMRAALASLADYCVERAC